jgi:hypothetical protein
MMYAFIQDVPIRGDMYARIREGLGAQPPAGLISHVVIEKADGLLRYVDVWESQAAWDAFVSDRLHPVIQRIFQQAGFVPQGEPPLEAITVLDAWTPATVPAS